jgi:hypothetical protein
MQWFHALLNKDQGEQAGLHLPAKMNPASKFSAWNGSKTEPGWQQTQNYLEIYRCSTKPALFA